MKPTLVAAEPVSAYDAKTHLPKLLGSAPRRRFVITRHGKPVAQLVPFEEGDEAAILQAIDKVEAIRTRLARQASRSPACSLPAKRRKLAHAGHRY